MSCKPVLRDVSKNMPSEACRGDVPTTALLVGSGIVVASGLFLLWHETKKKA